MIRSFADVTTADLWVELNSKAARRTPRELWPVVLRKLTMLDSAQRLEDVAAVPGNRFERWLETGRAGTGVRGLLRGLPLRASRAKLPASDRLFIPERFFSRNF